MPARKRLSVADAAIHCDEQVGFFLLAQFFDRLNRDTVSILLAMWKIKLHKRWIKRQTLRDHPYGMHKHGRATHAIRVIVSVHGDDLAILECEKHARDRFGHVSE